MHKVQELFIGMSSENISNLVAMEGLRRKER
jgi:hypothetical protein